MICALSRVLMMATIVGTVASSATGNQALGWIVGGVAAGIGYLVQYRYPALIGGQCAIPASQSSMRGAVAASARAEVGHPDGPTVSTSPPLD